MILESNCLRTIVVYHLSMGNMVAVVRLRSGGNRRWKAPAGKVKGRRAGVRIAVGSEGPIKCKHNNKMYLQCDSSEHESLCLRSLHFT